MSILTNIEDCYIVSTKPGFVWRVSTYKPQGQPGRCFAQEGKLERAVGVDNMFDSFSFVMFQDRREVQSVEGKLTDKAKRAAMTRMIEHLVGKGLSTGGAA